MYFQITKKSIFINKTAQKGEMLSLTKILKIVRN